MTHEQYQSPCSNRLQDLLEGVFAIIQRQVITLNSRDEFLEEEKEKDLISNWFASVKVHIAPSETMPYEFTLILHGTEEVLIRNTN